MAAPIAHIFCALALINQGKIKVADEQAFIIGTSFPDIRYLGVIKREQTHENNVVWNDVINASSSFEAGRLLHSLLDRIREEYVITHNLYDHVPTTVYRTHILKFFEDTLLYNQTDDWPKIVSYFNTILPDEQAFGIPDHYIRTWHQLIQQYIKQHPNAGNIAEFLKYRSSIFIAKESNPIKRLFKNLISIVKSKIVAYKLSRILKQLQKNSTVSSRIQLFYQNLPTHLSNNR